MKPKIEDVLAARKASATRWADELAKPMGNHTPLQHIALMLGNQDLFLDAGIEEEKDETKAIDGMRRYLDLMVSVYRKWELGVLIEEITQLLDLDNADMPGVLGRISGSGLEPNWLASMNMKDEFTRLLGFVTKRHHDSKETPFTG